MKDKEQKIKKRKKIDKSQFAIRIIALILVLGILIPTIASTIFYFIGE